MRDHPSLESEPFYPDPPPPPVVRILAREIGSLPEKPTAHEKREFRRIRGRERIEFESDYSDDRRDRPTLWVEIPAAFFTAN